jgi:hypothetical protein
MGLASVLFPPGGDEESVMQISARETDNFDISIAQDWVVAERLILLLETYLILPFDLSASKIGLRRRTHDFLAEDTGFNAYKDKRLIVLRFCAFAALQIHSVEARYASE